MHLRNVNSLPCIRDSESVSCQADGIKGKFVSRKRCEYASSNETSQALVSSRNTERSITKSYIDINYPHLSSDNRQIYDAYLATWTR